MIYLVIIQIVLSFINIGILIYPILFKKSDSSTEISNENIISTKTTTISSVAKVPSKIGKEYNTCEHCHRYLPEVSSIKGHLVCTNRICREKLNA